jgi:Calx-beta domain
VVVSVIRTGSATNAISVNYATSDGTAIAGTNYTAANGTLQWGANDASTKTISIAVSTAAAFSGDKTFSIALNGPSAQAMIGSPGTAVVTISGAASAAVGTLVLADASYNVSQSAQTVTISVNRTGGAVGAVSVGYQTLNGTAIAGTDYTSSAGTLNWADGDSASKSFQVTVSNASPFLGDKTFSVALSAPTGGVMVGNPQISTVTIAGDASPPVGSLQLSAATYSVGQGAGTVSITVDRTGGSHGAATVAYSTTNGTAAAGTDFTAASGTLQWADGDTAPKSFTVAISNATPFSGNKSFTVNLTTPSAGATISSPGNATVTINGDRVTPPPASTSTFWVYQNGVFNWGGDYSSQAVPNYKSTAGSPESGPYDIAVTLTGPWGIWAPYAGGTVPTWNFNATGYNYLTLDLKPTVPNQVWQLYFMLVGDVRIMGSTGQQTVINLADYGPAPVVGQWATYKIPLSLVLTQYSSGNAVYETGVYKFGLQDETGLTQNTWYVDNVGFVQ